jgi:hypothetical protein
MVDLRCTKTQKHCSGHFWPKLTTNNTPHNPKMLPRSIAYRVRQIRRIREQYDATFKIRKRSILKGSSRNFVANTFTYSMLQSRHRWIGFSWRRHMFRQRTRKMTKFSLGVSRLLKIFTTPPLDVAKSFYKRMESEKAENDLG